jgi:hypothetical protein
MKRNNGPPAAISFVLQAARPQEGLGSWSPPKAYMILSGSQASDLTWEEKAGAMRKPPAAMPEPPLASMHCVG